MRRQTHCATSRTGFDRCMQRNAYQIVEAESTANLTTGCPLSSTSQVRDHVCIPCNAGSIASGLGGQPDVIATVHRAQIGILSPLTFSGLLNILKKITTSLLLETVPAIMIRLLKFENGHLQIERIDDHRQLPGGAKYAILSHVWLKDPDEEVKYDDVLKTLYRPKRGYRKIELCGKQAKQDNCKYFWVDTCAINKSDSNELSEALNSMYMWYTDAKVCYAYLEDVGGKDGVTFEESKWFTRGWTLQELLAPETVRFYNHEWEYLGDKSDLSACISKITGIHQEVLRESSRIPNYSIAERMSWAAGRETGRVEDRAYSLMGIFGIDDMQMMYGQGATAFRRLQERIMAMSNDYSIFAWQGVEEYGPSMLATSPDAFTSTESIKPKHHDWDYKLSRFTVEISIRLDPCGPYTYRGMMNCADPSTGSYFAIYLRQLPATKKYARVTYKKEDSAWITQSHAEEFQALEQIMIYHDITEFKSKLQGAKLSDVPSMSFRIPAELLSAPYEAKALGGAEWDSIHRTFTISVGSKTDDGMIGSLELGKNKFKMVAVRVGFDRTSNPVCMLAKSHGLSHSGTGKKIAGAVSKLWMLPAVNFVQLGVAAATRAETLPAVHKGKGLAGYSADEGAQIDQFWDHDTVGTTTSGTSLVMDKNDRLGLWLVRGDRSLPTPVDVTLLANLEPGTAMPYFEGKKTGPAVKLSIKNGYAVSSYTWELDMRLAPFPHKRFYELRNLVRSGRLMTQDPGETIGMDIAMGKYGPAAAGRR
ncbi:hypothetical protein PMIN04_005167 [Paraphaeosphaeria minitans]